MNSKSLKKEIEEAKKKLGFYEDKLPKKQAELERIQRLVTKYTETIEFLKMTIEFKTEWLERVTKAKK